MWVEGQAEAEEEGDGEEEDVQGSTGILGKRARWWAAGEGDAESAVVVDGSGDDDGREENEDGFDPDEGGVEVSGWSGWEGRVG